MPNKNQENYFAERKVKDGKLVQVSLKKENKKIKDIKITGDFFIYPEEEKEKIERTLNGISHDKTIKELRKKINKKISPETELLGFNAKVIAELIKEASENERH